MGISKNIFVSYDINDIEVAMKLYEELKKHKQRPWIDRQVLAGGDKWNELIPSIINNDTDYFISLISNSSIRNNRFFKKEFEIAEDKMKNMPAGTKFIIPVIIDDCEIPGFTKKYHVLNLSSNDGYANLFNAIGVETIRSTHSFMEGSWIGYTIEDVSYLGGSSQQVFPCICDLRIKNNILEGEVYICYMGIGPTLYATLEVVGVPDKNTIDFKWRNKDNKINQRGMTYLEIISETKLTGTFAAKGVDAYTQGGNTVFFKVDFDHKSNLKIN